jgi:hypothetical protein
MFEQQQEILRKRRGGNNVVGRRTLCILLTPTFSSSDWLNDMSANQKAVSLYLRRYAVEDEVAARRKQVSGFMKGKLGKGELSFVFCPALRLIWHYA